MKVKLGENREATIHQTPRPSSAVCHDRLDASLVLGRFKEATTIEIGRQGSA